MTAHAAAGVLALATAVHAQSPPSRPVFGASTDLVYVTVTVQDAHGHIVPDLPAAAFEVREDGQPREIQVFSRGADERVALDVALLLDTSGSMVAELQT
jgi:Mg-chelatase subunit ChlD